MKAWVIRLSLYTILLTCFSICSVLFFYALHQIKECTFFIDPYCSASTSQELKHYVHQHHNNFFSTTIVKKLCLQFPFIEKSSIRLQTCGTMHCSIQCAHPRLLLNEEYALLSNNVVAQSTIFEQSLIQSLPRIFLSNNYSILQLSDTTKNILNDIPLHLFTDYTIHFIDPCTIYLVDKKNPHCLIVADKDSIKNIDTTHCTIIQEQEKKLLEKKSHLNLVMDVRFSHQIIVRLQAVQGGII